MEKVKLANSIQRDCMVWFGLFLGLAAGAAGKGDDTWNSGMRQALIPVIPAQAGIPFSFGALFGTARREVLRSTFAGSRPAAGHFSCLAKKSDQKKATRFSRPLRGFPKERAPKREACKLPFGSDLHASFSASVPALSVSAQGNCKGNTR
jgi:hypothetical protein